MTRYGTLIGQYRQDVIPRVKATDHTSNVYFYLMFRDRSQKLIKQF